MLWAKTDKKHLAVFPLLELTAVELIKGTEGLLTPSVTLIFLSSVVPQKLLLAAQKKKCYTNTIRTAPPKKDRYSMPQFLSTLNETSK